MNTQMHGTTPRLAGWSRRVGASVVDQLLTTAPTVIVLAGVLGSVEAGVGRRGEPVLLLAPGAWLALALAYAVSLWIWIWNRGLRQGRTGQSVGKEAARIRLVQAGTGRAPGAAGALVRDLAHILDGVFYIGYLWPLWDAQRQTFADKLCETVVVEV